MSAMGLRRGERSGPGEVNPSESTNSISSIISSEFEFSAMQPGAMPIKASTYMPGLPVILSPRMMSSADQGTDQMTISAASANQQSIAAAAEQMLSGRRGYDEISLGGLSGCPDELWAYAAYAWPDPMQRVFFT